jgi:hypothetical protein
VGGDVDVMSFFIVPQYIACGVGHETEEDTFSGIGAKFRWTFTRWSDPNATTKCAKMGEIVDTVECELERGNFLIAGRGGVADPETMVECIRPELDGKVRADEKRAYGVSDGAVSAFDGAVLVGCVGASGVDIVSELFEKCRDFRVVIQFTTLVEENVFVGAGGRMLGKKVA